MNGKAEQFITKLIEYDQGHPEIWERFKAFAIHYAQLGRTHFSAAYIIEMIRWDTEFDAPNDKQAAYYARKFMIEYDCLGFFKTTQSLVDMWGPWITYQIEKGVFVW